MTQVQVPSLTSVAHQCRSANRLKVRMFVLPSSALQRPSSSSGRRSSGRRQEEARPGATGPRRTLRPSIPQEQSNTDTIGPDPSPRGATADQTDQLLITERQLGSLSAGRARLIRTRTRVFEQKKSDGSVW